MRKIVLYLAMSLDGYIADKNGGVAWLEDEGGDSGNMGSYPLFYETIDTVIMGYRTYHQIVTELSPGHWFYADKKSYVLTHREQEAAENIVFTQKPVAELAAELKCRAGKDIWLCGGAAVANEFLALDLIDRFHISVMPTILGGGIPLFQASGAQTKLRLVSTQCYNGMVDLVYERRE